MKLERNKRRKNNLTSSKKVNNLCETSMERSLNDQINEKVNGLTDTILLRYKEEFKSEISISILREPLKTMINSRLLKLIFIGSNHCLTQNFLEYSFFKGFLDELLIKLNLNNGLDSRAVNDIVLNNLSIFKNIMHTPIYYYDNQINEKRSKLAGYKLLASYLNDDIDDINEASISFHNIKIGSPGDNGTICRCIQTSNTWPLDINNFFAEYLTKLDDLVDKEGILTVDKERNEVQYLFLKIID